VHAKDCTTFATKPTMLDRIERQITLAGEFSDEQRQRLLEIADICPVHPTLQGRADIHTRLVAAAEPKVALASARPALPLES
jgi:putative redox protein